MRADHAAGGQQQAAGVLLPPSGSACMCSQHHPSCRSLDSWHREPTMQSVPPRDGGRQGCSMASGPRQKEKQTVMG